MTHALTIAERRLDRYIHATPELRHEISQWITDGYLLDHHRSFDELDEIDVIPIGHEYMTDAR